jgi:hypothetical protein
MHYLVRYTHSRTDIWKCIIWKLLRVKFNSHTGVDFGNIYPGLALLSISDLIGAPSGLEVVAWKLIKGEWDNTGTKKCWAILVAV